MSRTPELIQRLRQNLIQWYLENRRPLPWRSNKDPYHIWLSEVMLQQTTVKAVIPYYEKFLLHFPKVQDLAKASPEQVNELWAGLGYYSRARNLHAAAKRFAQEGFPKTAAELLNFPGFGPYTANAGATFAFDEPVGVLDGNVIRLLSRQFGLGVDWWLPKGRRALQEIADQLAIGETPDLVNQGLIEMGATVCTPQSPTCILCPWRASCHALRENRISELPKKKPRRESEIWKWDVTLSEKAGRLPLVKNTTGPFLKESWIFPGTFSMAEQAPKNFTVRHSITHHDIYVRVDTSKNLDSTHDSADYRWVAPKDISQINPSSLLKKVLLAASVSLGIQFSGCKSTGKNSNAVPTTTSAATPKSGPTTGLEHRTPENSEKPSGTQITRDGSNTSPSWSPDGLKFLFASEARSGHRQKQIYEWSFASASEHRVVFCDGEAKDPVYWKDANQIAFLSNTDRLKERPLLLVKKPPTDDLFELFVYILNPLDIKKIGAPTDWYEKLTNTKRKSFANGHTAWLTDSTLHWSEHLDIKNSKAIAVEATDLQDLQVGSLHQDEIVMFSGISKGNHHRQIYAYWPSSDVLFMPFPTDRFNFSSPKLSPVDERLLFISDQTGKPQIYLTSIGGFR